MGWSGCFLYQGRVNVRVHEEEIESGISKVIVHIVK